MAFVPILLALSVPGHALAEVQHDYRPNALVCDFERGTSSTQENGGFSIESDGDSFQITLAAIDVDRRVPSSSAMQGPSWSQF
jgi:hypothetical protein